MILFTGSVARTNVIMRRTTHEKYSMLIAARESAKLC